MLIIDNNNIFYGHLHIRRRTLYPSAYRKRKEFFLSCGHADCSLYECVHAILRFSKVSRNGGRWETGDQIIITRENPGENFCDTRGYNVEKYIIIHLQFKRHIIYTYYYKIQEKKIKENIGKIIWVGTWNT